MCIKPLFIYEKPKLGIVAEIFGFLPTLPQPLKVSQREVRLLFFKLKVTKPFLYVLGKVFGNQNLNHQQDFADGEFEIFGDCCKGPKSSRSKLAQIGAYIDLSFKPGEFHKTSKILIAF